MLIQGADPSGPRYADQPPGASFRTDPPRIFYYQFFPVNWNLVKRETVLLLKTQYVWWIGNGKLCFLPIFRNCIL